jgi:hypothetical protein
MKVCSELTCPGSPKASVSPVNNRKTAGNSPATTTNGTRTTALRRLVYQDKAKALPLTTSRDFLMTTEWTAVIAELAIPNPMPTRERGMRSRKTPTKNPSVTIEQAPSVRVDGREWRKTNEQPTVKGRTRPRATW